MDTEHFIVRRNQLMDQLASRRAKDLSAYPFRIADSYGVKLPSLAKWMLSLAGNGGTLTRLLEIGIPLAMPFLMKKETPSFGRLIQRFFSPKA